MANWFDLPSEIRASIMCEVLEGGKFRLRQAKDADLGTDMGAFSALAVARGFLSYQQFVDAMLTATRSVTVYKPSDFGKFVKRLSLLQRHMVYAVEVAANCRNPRASDMVEMSSIRYLFPKLKSMHVHMNRGIEDQNHISWWLHPSSVLRLRTATSQRNFDQELEKHPRAKAITQTLVVKHFSTNGRDHQADFTDQRDPRARAVWTASLLADSQTTGIEVSLSWHLKSWTINTGQWYAGHRPINDSDFTFSTKDMMLRFSEDTYWRGIVIKQVIPDWFVRAHGGEGS